MGEFEFTLRALSKIIIQWERTFRDLSRAVIKFVCLWNRTLDGINRYGRPGFNPRSRHTKDYKKKWYLIPPCLTLSNIRYVSRINWSNPGKRVAPSPTARWSSYWKVSLMVTINYGRQLYLQCQDRVGLIVIAMKG